MRGPATSPYRLVLGKVGIRHMGADMQPLGVQRDLVESDMVYVDQQVRRLDLQLHQVEQGGAARDETSFRTLAEAREGIGGRCRLNIAERGHAHLRWAHLLRRRELS